MHGYDIVQNSSITQDSIQKRIAFLKEHLRTEGHAHRRQFCDIIIGA
ncbi:MAG: hypothetical protein ACLVJ6_03395 [Merdibacter sp.]